MSFKNVLNSKDSHILIAEEMADKIYNMPNEQHLEMLETIRTRLIKHNQVKLNQLRKFNK